MLVDALQHINEVIIRIDVAQSAGRQEALHNADVVAPQLGPAEQPVLFSHRDNPQGALEVICVDRYLGVVQVDRQADPAFSDICQRTEEGTTRQESLFVELLVDSGEEALEDRFRLFLSACELGLSRQAIVANLLLDLVQSADRVQCLVNLRWLDVPGVKILRRA